jgi:hypothetical protein
MAASEFRYSGKMGASPLAIAVVTIPAVFILSLIYGHINVYNPLIYVNFLMTMGYGYLIAWIIGKVARLAKCRSPLSLALLSFLMGLWALYAVWAAWSFALINRSIPALTPTLLEVYSNPRFLWTFITLVNTSGWFTIHNSTPSGIVLWIVWAIEAGAIVGIITFYPVKMLKGWVFCEPCGVWCLQKPDLARFSDPSNPEHVRRLKDGDLTVLAELPPMRPGNSAHIRVSSQRCAKCSETETIMVTRYWYVRNEKGVNEEKTKELTPHILLGPESLHALQTAIAAKAVAEQIPTAAPTTPPPATQ